MDQDLEQTIGRAVATLKEHGAVANQTPDAVEIAAVATVLHLFYTGVESIFKRIVIEVDGSLPAGPGAGLRSGSAWRRGYVSGRKGHLDSQRHPFHTARSSVRARAGGGRNGQEA